MKKIEEITLLYEISKSLNEHLDLRKSLYKVLAILSNSMHMIRGTVTILNPLRNEISIRSGPRAFQNRHRPGEIQAGGGDHRTGHRERKARRHSQDQ